MTHKPEPWRLEYADYRRSDPGGRPPDGERCVIVGDNGETVSFGEYEDWYAGEPDLERTVACVNALAGIETKLLVNHADAFNKAAERIADVLRRE